jgi:predicted patatin/cPLA2 family phospholipase
MIGGLTVDHPVLRAMLERRNGGGRNSCKLGLVIEGGGMRGVYSGGVLVALEQLGFTSVFDGVYAESAGAINACYFLAGQAQLGIRIYTEDLQTLRFVNPLRTAAVLDVGYVADVVLTQRKPLDVGAVLGSKSDLFVALTRARDGKPRLVDVKREELPLLTLLKATSAIVPLYNRPVLLDGIPYVDGGISNPVPIQSALDAGCTHVLVLLTRAPDFELLPFSKWQKFLLSPMLRGWEKEFVRTWHEERPRRYRIARDLALGRTPCAAAIAVIAPGPDSPRVSRTTLSPRKLNLAMRDAIRRTEAAFSPAQHGDKIKCLSDAKWSQG